MPMNDKTIKIPQVNQTEDVTYQSPYAAVTTIRVLALNPKTKQWDSAALDDCIYPQIKNGGKLDRRPLGSKLLLIGLIMVSLQLLPYFLLNFNPLKPLGGFVEALYFMASMISLSVGAYFLIGSWLNARPHTTVLFTLMPDQKHLIAVFPEWDSKDAEIFANHFRRAKRNL